MFAPLQLLPNAVSEIFASAADTGSLSLTDRYGLMAAIVNDCLEEDERRAVDRLLRAAMKGRLTISST